ncbi:apolipoprotein D-like [Anthonomus grandis grandis]|uniref:apolipoprotein D-like n=1 Tax=Anthonomus grandis grandis TaxID=2921223 RepID=UPI0021661C48|nr:apolipoprotein D-like [Anthonomus grandis grandis]
MMSLVAGWLIFVIFHGLSHLIVGYGLGGCPRIGYMPDFNLSLFTGHWYEIERSFYLMELISSCVSVDLETNRKGNLNVYVNSKSRVSGIFSISQGVATPTKKDPSLLLYKVSSKLPKLITKYLPGAGYYQIVHTDYKTYAILYSCSNFYLFHTDLVWVWARKKEIEAETRLDIYKILSKNHIDPERLTLPKNKNCTDDY